MFFYDPVVLVPCEDLLVVVDDATGLMWQRGGPSDGRLTFEEAEEYIAQLNAERWGGFDDWRLPTLEEAMSLMLPKDQLPADGLYLDPVFERDSPSRIWT
jgi:serine/threonine-protein kinase